MIEALWVMTYFKISLPTRNWDIAFFMVHRVFPGKAALIFRKKYSESRNP